jgi:4-diphosphocytidyl-2-C-methyl-D-erythritol kinase
MPELRANAKLTLHLRVTGLRADGFHEIDAVMVRVSEPHDVVAIEPAARTSLAISGPFAAGVPVDASNLAWRAADACGAKVAITIEKNIPSGAGLGGGSADAAAVLLHLGADEATGARLGADIPFCMHAGAARVRGVGELLEPMEMPARSVVIATPRFSCSTVAVYRAWDALDGPRTEPNDLEPAAFSVEPRLREFKAAVEAAAGHAAVLAGSGSSYAVLIQDAGAARAAYERMRDALDASVFLGSLPA